MNSKYLEVIKWKEDQLSLGLRLYLEELLPLEKFFIHKWVLKNMQVLPKQIWYELGLDR